VWATIAMSTWDRGVYVASHVPHYHSAFFPAHREVATIGLGRPNLEGGRDFDALTGDRFAWRAPPEGRRPAASERAKQAQQHQQATPQAGKEDQLPGPAKTPHGDGPRLHLDTTMASKLRV
jgi:hypothetical protein